MEKNMINQVILSGVLTADAEQRQLSKDAELSVLRVAYDRSYRDSNGNWQSIPSYFTVKVFDRRYLSRCKSLAKKGVCVTLAGELKQERWTDETGKNKSNIVIIANQLEFRQRIKKIDNAIEQKNAASNEDISDLVEAASANAREQSEDSIPVF